MSTDENFKHIRILVSDTIPTKADMDERFGQARHRTKRAVLVNITTDNDDVMVPVVPAANQQSGSYGAAPGHAPAPLVPTVGSKYDGGK